MVMMMDVSSSQPIPQTRVYENTLGHRVLQECRGHDRKSGTCRPILLLHSIAGDVADSLFQYDSYLVQPSGLAAGTTDASTAQTDPAAFDATTSMIWMQDAVRERMQAESTLVRPREELENYLNSPLVDFHAEKLDIIGLWG